MTQIFPDSPGGSHLDMVIVGAGPAGLMAAQQLSEAGFQVDLFDAMPSVGRKFLLAGKGGLNLTHSEARERFVRRYGDRSDWVQTWLQQLDATGLRQWAQSLGVETFVGTSGRVFPRDMKAAPLLRAWLQRLRHPAAGVPVRFHMRHRWVGWDGSKLVFEEVRQARRIQVEARAVLLALGGASWPHLGSDGRWVPLLQGQAVQVQPLQASNCGFDVMGRDGQGWTPWFAERFAGQPFKSVALGWIEQGQRIDRRGEFVATASGIEGSLVYAASAALRDTLSQQGRAQVWLDLLPDRTLEQVRAAVSHPRGARSLSSHLKGRLGLEGIKMGLLHELLDREQMQDVETLAAAIKALPVELKSPRPVAEAISTAGGVAQEALDEGLMLRARPGVFCAGEMLDWEAPTGGYLLTAVMASGRHAAQAMVRWCRQSGGNGTGGRTAALN